MSDEPRKTRKASPLTQAIRDVEKAKKWVAQLVVDLDKCTARHAEIKQRLATAQQEYDRAKGELGGLL